MLYQNFKPTPFLKPSQLDIRITFITVSRYNVYTYSLIIYQNYIVASSIGEIQNTSPNFTAFTCYSSTIQSVEYKIVQCILTHVSTHTAEGRYIFFRMRPAAKLDLSNNTTCILDCISFA